jgi:hypothetical protein
MAGAGATTSLKRILRLALFTLGLAPAVAVVLIGIVRFQHDIPAWVYWKAALFFVIAVEIAYALAAACSILGALVLGFLFVSGKGRGISRPVLARGLLLTIAVLCGSVVAEAVCARWISWSHRFSAVPVGGLSQEENASSSARFAAPLEKIELNLHFPDPPGDRDIDLVVLGESSAEGVPFQQWVSVGKIVAWKLEQSIPRRAIRLHVLARAGDTLETQHLILSNLKRRPELILIYCGHNEFYSRLFWSRNVDHYVLDKRPTRWDEIVVKLEQSSAICTLIRETADKCRIALAPPASHTRDLVDVPVYTPTEYRLILSDFHNRLEELVSYAERVGALPVLILPPANDAGFEPNRSFLPPLTPNDERNAFAREFLAARQTETVGPATAIKRYRALLARQPCFAETHYRLAQLLEQTGDWDEAYRHYVLARNLDGMPMRCLSSFHDAYREVASRHGCILIDGQSYFHATGRHGLLDDELFQDAMHPSLRGQIALAQAVLGALHARRAFDWPRDSAVPVVDPAECAAHFGIDRSAWRHAALWWNGFNELMDPFRYESSQRSRKKAAGRAAVAQIDAGIAPEKVGLPNVGIPAPVPVIENKQELGPEPALVIGPCLPE